MAAIFSLHRVKGMNCNFICRCSVFLLERETNELVAKVFDGDIRKEREVSITKLLTSSHFSVCLLSLFCLV